MPSASGTNVILYIQLTGYSIAALLSLCITIPMSMHQDNFKGHCLLFSTGEWRETDGQFVVEWASQAYCNYTIFVGVIMLVISATQIYRLSKFVYKGRDSSFLSAFIDVLTSAFMCWTTLTAALFITLGFNTWCGEMTRRFGNCADATENDIDKADAIDPKGFYMQLFAAQFGVWLSWTTWMGLLVFAVVKLCKYHQQENIRVSMAKERKRLINEDLVTDVPTSHRPGRDNPAQDTTNKPAGNQVDGIRKEDLLN